MLYSYIKIAPINAFYSASIIKYSEPVIHNVSKSKVMIKELRKALLSFIFCSSMSLCLIC